MTNLLRTGVANVRGAVRAVHSRGIRASVLAARAHVIALVVTVTFAALTSQYVLSALAFAVWAVWRGLHRQNLRHLDTRAAACTGKAWMIEVGGQPRGEISDARLAAITAAALRDRRVVLTYCLRVVMAGVGSVRRAIAHAPAVGVLSLAAVILFDPAVARQALAAASAAGIDGSIYLARIVIMVVAIQSMMIEILITAFSDRRLGFVDAFDQATAAGIRRVAGIRSSEPLVLHLKGYKPVSEDLSQGEGWKFHASMRFE